MGYLFCRHVGRAFEQQCLSPFSMGLAGIMSQTLLSSQLYTRNFVVAPAFTVLSESIEAHGATKSVSDLICKVQDAYVCLGITCNDVGIYESTRGSCRSRVPYKEVGGDAIVDD